MKNLREKLFRSETIFYLAVFLLPFENFAFAPSTGWAALSPIFFALYLALNLGRLWDALKTFKKIIIFFTVGVLIGLIMAYVNNANFGTLFSTIFPVGLGGIQLLSFYTFYKKNRSLEKVINLLVLSYCIALVIGFVQFIAVKTENQAIVDFFNLICKRSYLGQDRVQFFFTEPSFIGMHLFAVLLPLYLLTKRKDLLFVTILFLLCSILFGSGVRIIVDAFVVAVILAAFYIKKHKQYKFIPLILTTCLVAFFSLLGANGRFRAIVNSGIYSDGSLATRYFRIQSTVIGYGNTFPSVLTGYGLGNSIAPLTAGYDTAAELYTNGYVKEVEELGDINNHNDSISFSLELRMINEFGLIIFIVALAYLIKLTKSSTFEYKWVYFAIILYSYLQFESYAFYAIWLFIAIMYFTRRLPSHAPRSEKPRRILVFGINDNPGGVESFLMNYYCHFDHKELQLDFLCNTKTVAYEDEIKSLGGRIFRITARSENRKKYRKELHNFFAEHAGEYDVIWENVCSLANIDYLIEAENFGIPRRIIHAHSDHNMDSRIRGLVHKFNRYQIKYHATDFWACSKNAGIFFFPKSVTRSPEYKIINNAIDFKTFTFNAEIRKKYRKDLGLSDKKILMNVGRLNFQKNQIFLIDILKELVAKDPSYHLILVGEGEDRKRIETKISALKLQKHVTLLGLRNDLPKLYSAADLVVFPSLFEGLSLVTLETEATGTPLVLSSEINIPIILLAEHSYQISLSEDATFWANTIIEALSETIDRETYSKSTADYLTNLGYNIETEAKLLQAELLK